MCSAFRSLIPLSSPTVNHIHRPVLKILGYNKNNRPILEAYIKAILKHGFESESGRLGYKFNLHTLPAKRWEKFQFIPVVNTV